MGGWRLGRPVLPASVFRLILGGRALALVDVFLSESGVLGAGQCIELARRPIRARNGLVPCFFVTGGRGTIVAGRVGVLLKKSFEEWATPTASRSGASAFANLARSAKRFNADKVDDFSVGHMKTKANMIFGVHVRFMRAVDLVEN